MHMLTRGLAYLVLAGVLLAAAIAFNHRQYPIQALKTESPAAPGTLHGQLAHCRAIGLNAVNDATCKEAWDANRKRFFETSKVYQVGVPDDVLDRPDLSVSASRSGGELARTAPEWPATPTAHAPRTPGDTLGESQ